MPLHEEQRGRIGGLFIFFVFFYAIIIARLYILQIGGHDFFAHLAAAQYESSITMQQERGLIYDRTAKVPLAYNRDATSLFIVPNNLSDSAQTKAWLKKEYPACLPRLEQKKKSPFMWIDRCMSEEQIEKIEKVGLKDLHIMNEPQRFYLGNYFANIIGFTDIDNKGISGIEALFEKRLGGKPTHFDLCKDARSKGFYFTKQITDVGIAGKPVVLTIDAGLQFLAYEEVEKTVQEYEAKSGAAVILDALNGEILAMTSYHNTNLEQSEPHQEKIVKNIPVHDCHELGSVMKIFTALGALEEQLVRSDELIDCEGKVCRINGLRLENWKSTGLVSFADVVKNSSNVGMAKVALRLGSKLYEHLLRLGFSKPTRTKFPGERSGFVNPPEKWSKFSPMTMSFGYEFSATLVQLARAFAIISNGGYDLATKIVMIPEARKPQVKKQLYTPETIEDIKNIMAAIGSHYPINGYRVLGKTGTARCVRNGRYSTTAHVYTFAGLIEKNGYRRVVVTFIDEPKKAHLWASQVAAPLFQRIAQKMVLYEKNS